MKKLGVIGGLGPLATAEFYKLITEMTDADCDQDHMEIMICSNPKTPDRTDYILGNSYESPGILMGEAIKDLNSMNADYIAIPCVTAHYFYDYLSGISQTPIINIVNEITRYLKKHKIKSVGIMATEGTIKNSFLCDELIQNDIQPILPDKESQDIISEIIYRGVKANRPINREQFSKVAEKYRVKGAEIILLACTDLSIIKNNYNIGSGFLDSLEILAMSSILKCGGQLKKEYTELITK